MATVKSGWDKPLGFRYEMKLAELFSAIRQYTPVGTHSHDQISGSYHAAGFPRSGGRLKREVGKLGNYKAPKDKNKVTINYNLPYAAILEFGGRVGAVVNKLMGWHSSGGDVVRRNRRGYTLQGIGYIDRGAQDWIKAIGGTGGVKVTWK